MSASSTTGAIMAAPASPGNTRWQTGRVPKLSYRKPLSAEDAANLPVRGSVNIKPDAEITPIATTAPPVVSQPRSQSMMSFQPPANKKKSSLFGGLFAKEPTLVALAEVEAELRTKHGAATAERVPHVSSRKMPAHVPKVNSKWDGLPEMARAREREQRGANRASQYDMYGPPNGSPSEWTDQAQHMRRNSELDGNVELWRGRTAEVAGAEFSYSSASSVISQKSANRAPTADSITAPELTPSYTSHPKLSKSTKPARHVGSTTSAHTSSDSSSGVLHSRVGASEQPGLVPDHSRSPDMTPRETSPVTPGYNPDMRGLRIQAVPELDAMRGGALLTSAPRSKHLPLDAFLAGEAQALEIVEHGDNSDDAQKGRRHHKASASQSAAPHAPVLAKRTVSDQQVSRQDAAPWETQGPPLVPTRSEFRDKAQKRRSKGMGLFR